MIVIKQCRNNHIEEIYQYYQPMNHPRIRRPCTIISSFLFMAEAEVTELETDPAFHSALLRVCV